jgi:hypothetical protein
LRVNQLKINGNLRLPLAEQVKEAQQECGRDIPYGNAVHPWTTDPHRDKEYSNHSCSNLSYKEREKRRDAHTLAQEKPRNGIKKC